MSRTPHEGRSPPQAWRILTTALLSSLSCWFSIHLTQTPCGIALIWPANGLLLAILLTTDRRLWPAYIGLSFVANVATATIAHHVPSRALPLGCCNLAEVTAGAYLIRRVLGRTPDLSAPGAFARFLAISGGLTPACCATAQAAILTVWWHAPFLLAALACFCAHSLGNSVMVPATLAILRVDRASLAEIFSKERRARTTRWLLLYSAVLIGVFCQTRYPLLFAIPPLLLGVVAEVGTTAIALCIPPLAAVSCLATTLGRGPFVINSHLGQFERIILVQLFVLAALMMSARVARMLSERQRSHATLQAERDRAEANEARFRLLTEHALDVVKQADSAGRYVYWSPSAERIYGRPPEILLGMTAEFVHPDDVGRLEAMRGQLLRGDVTEAAISYRTMHPTRGEVWIEARARGLRHRETGKPDGYVSVGRDVTERVQLEAEGMARKRELELVNAELQTSMRHLARARNQAEDASRAKTRFLAGVSHELRTPLNGVLGHAQLLQIGGGLSEDQSAHIEAMLGAGKHLLTMINSVLDLSQIEADRLELNLEIVDVAALARDCLELVGPSAAAKQLTLLLQCEPDSRVHVFADILRLRQVLLNLIGNAIKFTASGSVVLRISTEAMKVGVEIVDTGPGISAGLQSRLFQDFERLDLDANRDVEGAGLGLALSARLATLMNGSLGYRDNPVGGSIFRLELTGILGETPRTQPARAIEADGTSLRVLVVDDVAMNRDIACAFLRSLGHEPTQAGDGAAAVQAVCDGDFDVVVMDVRMPGVDGLEATRRIRALDGPRAGIAVVALTAQAFSEQVEQCRRVGMDAHATKPVTREALMAAIEEARRCAGSRGGDAEPARREETSAPVFDREVYGRIARVLDRAALETHVGALVDQSLEMREALGSGRDLGGGRALVEAAHVLAGHAGMLGFTRLAAAAAGLERATELGSDGAGASARQLCAAITATLPAATELAHEGRQALADAC